MAKQVGLTTSEVAKLSIAFFRQGREARDALELTRVAAEFAKIAAISVNDAANFLTAAINGFNLAASDATMIIDKFAALGAGAAASAQEIAIALSKVAPAAASAGVEVDTLMAFVTKGIETTREAPENIGTAFKTIFARMRQLTDLGKTVEDGMDVNRVDNALKAIGVSLRDANGEFRDLDDVLLEVGKRWSSIDRNQQAYVATSLAGTRQQTRLIALFEDFDRTLELIEVSQNAAGEAAIQHDEYMQGMEATVTRLKTSFQELITSFANADVIIGIINALNTAIELLNTRVGRLAITMGSLFLGFKAIQNAERGFLLGVQNFFKGVEQEDGTRAVSLFSTLTKPLMSKQGFDTFLSNSKKTFKDFVKNLKDPTSKVGKFGLEFKQIPSFMKTAFTSSKKLLQSFSTSMANGFTGLVSSIRPILQSIGKDLEALMLKPILEANHRATETIAKTIQQLQNKFGQMNFNFKVESLDGTVFSNTLRTLGESFQNFRQSFTGVNASLKSFADAFAQMFSQIRKLSFDPIVNGVKNLHKNVKEGTKAYRDYLKYAPKISQTTFDMSGSAEAAANNARLQSEAIDQLKGKMNGVGKGLVGFGGGLKKLGTMMIAPFKMLGAFLMSPAGIVMAILGLVVAIKKIREANDTTNPTIARLKVVFDR